MTHEPERPVSKSEIITLVKTELRVFVEELVQEMIAVQIQPFHQTNVTRFEVIERSLAGQNVEIASIKQQNVSQNRHIEDIADRQAERYLGQEREEVRAEKDRQEIKASLAQIGAKIRAIDISDAKMQGEERLKQRYWTNGKKLVIGGAGLATWAGWHTVWEAVKRWLSH